MKLIEQAILNITNTLRLMVPHANRRTVCPPGDVGASTNKSSDLPNVLIITEMRSGTHLLIDLVLNNFPVFKTAPLYLDLDQWLDDERPPSSLKSIRGKVIKTHLLHRDVARYCDALGHLKGVIILSTLRNRHDMVASQHKFLEEAELARGDEDFERKLIDLDVTVVEYFYFDSLTNKQEYEQNVDRLSKLLPSTVTPRINRLARATLASGRVSVLVSKLLTRWFGDLSPVVNTSISFKQ
jgi:hypothetical protein